MRAIKKLLLKGAIIPGSLIALVYSGLASPFTSDTTISLPNFNDIEVKAKQILDSPPKILPNTPTLGPTTQSNKMIRRIAILLFSGAVVGFAWQALAERSLQHSRLMEKRRIRREERLERERVEERERRSTVPPEDRLPEHPTPSEVSEVRREDEEDDDDDGLDSISFHWLETPKAWLASLTP